MREGESEREERRNREEERNREESGREKEREMIRNKKERKEIKREESDRDRDGRRERETTKLTVYWSRRKPITLRQKNEESRPFTIYRVTSLQNKVLDRQAMK